MIIHNIYTWYSVSHRCVYTVFPPCIIICIYHCTWSRNPSPALEYCKGKSFLSVIFVIDTRFHTQNCSFLGCRRMSLGLGFMRLGVRQYSSRVFNILWQSMVIYLWAYMTNPFVIQLLWLLPFLPIKSENQYWCVITSTLYECKISQYFKCKQI